MSEINIPKGWTLTTIGSVALQWSGDSTLIKGQLLKEPAKGLFPAYSASGQDVWHTAYQETGDAIIVSAVGARCGKVFKASGQWSAIANTHVVKIHPDAADFKYFYYLLNREHFWVKSGTAQPFVKVKATFERPFLLPPLKEQQRIVAKIEELFSELDKGIENLKQARTQLTVYRQALLKHAFEGKLTADWRAEHTRGEQSASHETLPLGWTITTVAGLGTVETGTTPPTRNPALYGGKLPFFKPTDLEQGINVREARTYLSELGRLHARILPAGTTLVTCIGATIGKTGLARSECATNQQINSISPADGVVSEFVYYEAISPRFQEQIKNNASSTTLPILNKSKFSKLPIVLCPREEQLEIVRVLDAQFTIINALESDIEANLQKAEALRQSILKKAFAGELVPQDPADEAASELLARIRAEREAAPSKRRASRTALESSSSMR